MFIKYDSSLWSILVTVRLWIRFIILLHTIILFITNGFDLVILS